MIATIVSALLIQGSVSHKDMHEAAPLKAAASRSCASYKESCVYLAGRRIVVPKICGLPGSGSEGWDYVGRDTSDFATRKFGVVEPPPLPGYRIDIRLYGSQPRNDAIIALNGFRGIIEAFISSPEGFDISQLAKRGGLEALEESPHVRAYAISPELRGLAKCDMTSLPSS